MDMSRKELKEVTKGAPGDAGELVTDFVYLMGIGAEEAGRVVYWKCQQGDFG